MLLTAAAVGLLMLASVGAAAAQQVAKAQGVELDGVELTVGSKLPYTVEIHPVPNVKNCYAIIDNHIVVVDPDTRKIVKFID